MENELGGPLLTTYSNDERAFSVNKQSFRWVQAGAGHFCSVSFTFDINKTKQNKA